MLKRRLPSSVPPVGRGGMVVASLLLLVVIALTLAACASPAPASAPLPTPGGNTKPSGVLEQKWIEPLVSSDTISIPVSELESDWNTRFRVQTASGEVTAMAYILDGKTYVRANVCPPCRSVGFRLSGNTLICMSCATKFSATTGEGISGACVNYPKAAVNYEVNGGNIVISKADLLGAYQNTLSPGWP